MPKETKRAAVRRLVSGFLERNPQTVTTAAVTVAAVKPTATAAPVAFRVAAEVPSWCHPCGDERAHRVVAMTRTGKPRVQCVSCQGVHAYRDPAAKVAALAKVAAATAKRAAREVAKVERAAAKAAKPPKAEPVAFVTTPDGARAFVEGRANIRAAKRLAVEARKAARAERKATKQAEKDARAAERARRKAARERPPGELRRLLITRRNEAGKVETVAVAVIVPRDAMAKRPLYRTDAELAERKAARAAEADERKAREKRRLLLRRKNSETCAAIGYRERRRNRPPATAGAKAGQRCSCDANSAGQKWAARMVREIHRGA